MFVPKYNLLSLYNAIYIYVLRADHWVLSNQLMGSFLLKGGFSNHP